jgi:hypothetical protein
MPFDVDLVTIDYCEPGMDCRRGVPEPNHHVVVGERHRRLVTDAHGRGLDTLFVFEDDAEFVAAPADALGQALRWLRRYPTRWDIFYLGFLAPRLSRCAWVARGVIRPSRPLFAHALGYHRRAFRGIEAIDFTRDHRPLTFRTAERFTSSRAARGRYFLEGVGSIDTWLAHSALRRYATYPALVVQHQLPPGTETTWQARTGRPYDVYDTPTRQVTAALVWHYAVLGGLGAFVALLVWWLGGGLMSGAAAAP